MGGDLLGKRRVSAGEVVGIEEVELMRRTKTHVDMYKTVTKINFDLKRKRKKLIEKSRKEEPRRKPSMKCGSGEQLRIQKALHYFN